MRTISSSIPPRLQAGGHNCVASQSIPRYFIQALNRNFLSTTSLIKAQSTASPSIGQCKRYFAEHPHLKDEFGSWTRCQAASRTDPATRPYRRYPSRMINIASEQFMLSSIALERERTWGEPKKRGFFFRALYSRSSIAQHRKRGFQRRIAASSIDLIPARRSR
ncbi:hypothetical protein HPP92_024017 [Vanilla planifolia]|uniref:Uncharacterized protein n=1 Tax=Vanilla planifolia TaxID=51239 RepID=A0A835PMS7_VANPL|nr:hypothetical protein HPP92_024469 [Vanilla planifolia]KAG0456229.1 hypothetical protein HPP92_024017 [Vanilla planifolia]